MKFALTHYSRNVSSRPFAVGSVFKILLSRDKQFSLSVPVIKAIATLQENALLLEVDGMCEQIPYSLICALDCYFGDQSNLPGHTISITWNEKKVFIACVRWSVSKFAIFNTFGTLRLFEELKKKVPINIVTNHSKLVGK